MAFMAPYAMYAAAAVSAAAAVTSANTAAANSDYQANVARYNAKTNQQNSDAALAAANANEEAARRSSSKSTGNLIAANAENGIGLDSGTATDLVEASAMSAELDALNARYSGKVQSNAYLAQRDLAKGDEQVAIINGRNAQQAGYLTAGASVLSAYGKYSKMNAGGKMPKGMTRWDE